MDAKKEIRRQLDEMFETAPDTRAAWELREELYANCMERYQDLTGAGMEPETALNTVMGSIGNVDELVAALPGEASGYGPFGYDEAQQRAAITTAVAVGLYILAGAVFFLGVFIGAYLFEQAIFIGIILALIICIVPTVMLVYNAKRYPKYKKNEETVVEEFKEWSNESKKAKSLRSAVSSLLWTLTVVIYLGVSFLTHAWHITWIIFLIATCIEAAINLAFRLGGIR